MPVLNDDKHPQCAKCVKWFHLACEGITRQDLPADDWLCKDCASHSLTTTTNKEKLSKENEELKKLNELLETKLEKLTQELKAEKEIQNNRNKVLPGPIQLSIIEEYEKESLQKEEFIKVLREELRESQAVCQAQLRAD